MIGPGEWGELYTVLKTFGALGEYGQNDAIAAVSAPEDSRILAKISLCHEPYRMRLIVFRDLPPRVDLFLSGLDMVNDDKVIPHLDALALLGAKVERENIARFLFAAGAAWEAGMSGAVNAQPVPGRSLESFMEKAFQLALDTARRKVGDDANG